MLRIENENEIHINRGDAGVIDFIIPLEGCKRYTFNVGDTITFGVYERNGFNKCPLLFKTIEIEKATDICHIELTKEDTTIGDLINREVEYWYEIQYNDNETVLGYDEDGAKIFMLYPEGKICNKGDEEDVIEGQA